MPEVPELHAFASRATAGIAAPARSLWNASHMVCSRCATPIHSAIAPGSENLCAVCGSICWNHCCAALP